MADFNKKTLVHALFAATQAVREGRQMMEELDREVLLRRRQREELQRVCDAREEELAALQGTRVRVVDYTLGRYTCYYTCIHRIE